MGYNAGYVNSHGIELYLIDAKKRLVRKYHTVLWNNADVLRDISRVLMENATAVSLNVRPSVLPVPDSLGPGVGRR